MTLRLIIYDDARTQIDTSHKPPQALPPRGHLLTFGDESARPSAPSEAGRKQVAGPWLARRAGAVRGLRGGNIRAIDHSLGAESIGVDKFTSRLADRPPRPRRSILDSRASALKSRSRRAGRSDSPRRQPHLAGLIEPSRRRRPIN